MMKMVMLIKKVKLAKDMKLIFELPFYSPSVGGVVETIKFAEAIHELTEYNVGLRFQRKTEKPKTNLAYSYGLPDKHFPLCDVVVTYSDTPYLQQLLLLPQVGKTMIYMLSYGMAQDREYANSHNSRVTCMCSTEKIRTAILNDGYANVHKIGFALNMDDMWEYGNERKYIQALYYHPMASKRYKLAVDLSMGLFGQGLIDNTISFGTHIEYSKFAKPPALISHTFNADRGQIRNIFNDASFFVNTSFSEGLNLTPIEATLCGCPSIVCDGADELFIDGVTCFKASQMADYDELMSLAKELINDRDYYADTFRLNMQKLVAEYTMPKLVDNFIKLI